MKNIFTILLVLLSIQLYCQNNTYKIITSDLENFWTAYDLIHSTKDTTKHAEILKEYFLEKGSQGLISLKSVRNYSDEEYLYAIRNYPKFWNSIRPNTDKSKLLVKDLETGIGLLKDIYPELKPSEIYFAMGVFRTPGTTLNSSILIGAEMAMGDEKVDLTEFSPEFQNQFAGYYKANPIDNIVLLNIHEFVHTQQKPMVHNLLSLTLYEGIAEFVSVKALGVQSSTPAIQFGKENIEEVRNKFEYDLFRPNTINNWLWNDSNNYFKIRDLGYFVGYEMAERYFNSQTDKKKAIKKLIELDYSNEVEIENFVDQTKFLSVPLNELFSEYDKNRPSIIATTPDLNGLSNVDSSVQSITLHFSEPMNKETRGFELGPLGEKAILYVQNVIGYSEDGKSFTFEVKMEKGKRYQIHPSNRFISAKGYPLKYHLIDFETAN